MNSFVICIYSIYMDYNFWLMAVSWDIALTLKGWQNASEHGLTRGPCRYMPSQ